MINRLPIKLIAVVLAVLGALWLLLSGPSSDVAITGQLESNSSALVSAIQPIADAGAGQEQPGVASGVLNTRQSKSRPPVVSGEQLLVLTRRFDAANRAIENGQLQAASRDLEAITKEFPSVIEPYLNLSSIYAEQQQLEKARAVLLRGFESNLKAGMLFDHLKKVHGALAATSYRQALDTGASNEQGTKLNLARVTKIVTELDQSNRIAMLEREVEAGRNRADGPSSDFESKKILALEAKLEQIEARDLAVKKAYSAELGALQEKLSGESQALSLSQTAQREALARVVRAERDASNKVAEITKQLELQKASLVAANAFSAEQSTALAKAQQSRVAALQEVENLRLAIKTSQASVRQNEQASDTTEQQEQHRKAIGLVQSWAKAWSAQNVSAYVSHYVADYSSSRSLSRSQWLEQRSVRLTNKKFINVKTGAFVVRDLGAQFSVTFSQHYQSDTVDDTVTKRLTFAKNIVDWSKSKIVAERLVSN